MYVTQRIRGGLGGKSVRVLGGASPTVMQKLGDLPTRGRHFAEAWEQIEGDPTVRGGPRRWLLSVAVAVAVGTAYFLGAQLSLAHLTAVERVAVFWPASGIAAGALVALGRWARVPSEIAVPLYL